MAEPVTTDPRVALARAGDDGAFASLYDEYSPRLYRFLLLRVQEPADAEDLLQRVFLKVIEALPAFEDRGLPFGAWLFRIARNAAIDFERSHRSTAPLDALVDRPVEFRRIQTIRPSARRPRKWWRDPVAVVSRIIT